MGSVGMGVQGTADARALQRRLRAAAAGGLQRELARALQRAGRPVLMELKRAALSLPATGPDSTGLRKKIAAATRSAPRIGGVRFYVASAALGGQAMLPQKIHDAAGWWHPVYGRRPNVFQDRPAVPWFTTTVMANEDRLRQAVEDAMQLIADMI